MDTANFLRTVWPDAGHYCLAIPRKTPSGETWWQHIVRPTIEEALNQALALCASADVYFCVHSLKQPGVWDANKVNRKDNSKGGYRVRTQKNMHSAACFFGDLDVELGNPAKFQSQADALQSLTTFCDQTKLPLPWVVLSGNGVHIYWPIETALESTLWREEAHKLRLLAQYYRFRMDPMRIDDQASVLRVPGTLHHKDPTNPKPVILAREGAVTPTSAFLATLDAALARVVPNAPQALRVEGLEGTPPAAGDWDSNLEGGSGGAEAAAPSLEALGAACAQIRWMIQNPAEVTQPQWYLGLLNTARFCDDGDAAARMVSKYVRVDHGHSADEVEEKLQQLKDGNFGPATCGKIQDLCGRERCQDCPFLDKLTSSPVVLARQVQDEPIVPAAEVLHEETGFVENLDVPPPPEKYKRTRNGIVMTAVSADGKEVGRIIHPCDLYPILVVNNEVASKRLVIWRAFVPKKGMVEFTATIEQLYDSRTFIEAVANAGVVVLLDNVNDVKAYMIAYIKELQKYAAEQQQHPHLGWTADHSQFVMPDRVISKSGNTRAIVSKGVITGSRSIRKEGTLEKQVELMEFYNRPEYVSRQFAICCGLASPLYYMTGHHGVVVNLTGEPGASKSTSLYTAASFWGSPEEYVMNGTTRGMTANARYARLAVLANLPACVDEITAMSSEDAVDLALSITQPSDRGRCDKDGTERPVINTDKSTIMITTSNRSLHEALSLNNASGTAASMRVFEIGCEKLYIHTPAQADEFLRQIKVNFGHIGPAFMDQFIREQEEIVKAVHQMMAYVGTHAKVDQAERFWGSVGTIGILGAQLGNRYGLLPFDPNLIAHWLMTTQMQSMRGVITNNYSSPLECLMTYIDVNMGGILCVHGAAKGMLTVTRGINRDLLGRYELDTPKIMYVAVDQFKTYCRRNGFVFSAVVDYLASHGIATKTRIVLGKGTSEYAHGQVWTLRIDMTHKDITGSPQLTVIDKKAAEPAPTPLIEPVETEESQL